MKIASVDIYPIMSWRPHLFVTVTADDGTYGVGESGLSWQEKPIAAAIERFSELVVGEDPMRTEHLWQLMARASSSPPTGSIAPQSPPSTSPSGTSRQASRSAGLQPDRRTRPRADSLLSPQRGRGRSAEADRRHRPNRRRRLALRPLGFQRHHQRSLRPIRRGAQVHQGHGSSALTLRTRTGTLR